jgi:hypothetical protein
MRKRTWLFILPVVIIGSSFAWLRIKDHASLSDNKADRRWTQASPDISKLHTGDLIFRYGRGFISEALMSLNQKEKKYSHAGIIKIENGNAFVYHAIGGQENESNKLRKDLLRDFCKPANAYSFGIYKLDISSVQRETIDSLANYYFKFGLEFDTDFDLNTDSKMYCTEFVYKVFSIALRNGNFLSSSSISGLKYIACDDLYINPHSILIYSHNYESTK